MSGGSIEIRDMVARRGSFSLRVDELHIEPHEIVISPPFPLESMK